MLVKTLKWCEQKDNRSNNKPIIKPIIKPIKVK